ncbi:MAG TPA: response regulator [Deferrisomatales bacterium]|nr:response regulator [Deferrisomatales bacterium]
MAAEGDRPRVVVVDDAVFMRNRLRDLLEAGGFEVVAEGQDGAEALELYAEHRPDLLTLDLVMPRMTGVEALEELLRQHPGARVLVCSSLSDQPTIFAAIRLGARDYVLKPVDADKLLDAARKAVTTGGEREG